MIFLFRWSNEVKKKFQQNDLFSAGKIIILGMPGAFTKTCSAIHLPGYVKNYDQAKKRGYKNNLFIS